MEPLEDVPWVLVGVQGGAYVASCQVCGATAHGGDAAINAFADAHAQHTSPSPTHFGMGDLVASTAKMLGLGKPCTPCEQRRQALNNAIPQVPFLRR
jgi:hypothetical protein